MTLFRRIAMFVLLLIGTQQLAAQTIKGVVKDADGVGLPGASVLIAGTTKGIFTSFDGTYELSVEPGTYNVKCSFVGFITQTKEVTVGDGATVTIDFDLKEDAVFLDDVIVVGYGVQRRREVTGSIEKVGAKALTALPAPSFEAALQGQAAGVQVSQGSGVAGSGSLIRVRGIASVSAGGDPLYVVDGIPITQDYFLRGNSGALNNNPLASINPNDIESVEILKDAAATGIYGSRGANGVILITTKRGSQKGTKFEFSTRHGVSTPASLPNMTNTEQYLSLRQEAWENDGGTGYVWLPNFTSANDDAATREAAFKNAMNTDTDWVDQTIGTGFKQMYSFGVRNGGEKYGLYAGLTYDDNQSFLIGNSYERFSGRANFDYTVNEWLKVAVNASVSRGINNRVDVAWSGGLGNAMSTALPFYPVTYDEDVFDDNGELLHQAGDFFIWSGSQNPVAYQELKKWRTQEDRSINNASLLITPNEDLTFKVSGGFDYMHLREDIFNPGALTLTSDLGNANRFANYVLNWNYSATANYLWDYGEYHKFNFMVGTEFQRSDSYGYGVDYFDVEGPVWEVDSLRDDAANVNRTENNPSQWSFLSYFGRVNYTLKDKFIFQGTARVDGSSRFGRNNRYGFFPSASAGWIVSEEPWMQDVEKISYLKVRTSYGITGNAAIPDYARFGTFSQQDNGILYNQQPILFPLQLANPNLRWETSRTWDAAIELGLWDDRVTMELGAYHKLSSDVLLNVNVSPSTGFTNYWDNVAEILNRGVEFQIKTRNIVGEFNWTTDLNIARNYNELKDIGSYTPDAVSGGTNDSRVIVGQPVGSFFLVEFSHVDPENGLPVYLDLEGNETYDYDNAIRKYVGDGLPDVVGGFNNSFSWKNWDLSALMTFSIGAKIFDSSSKRQLGVVTDWNMRTEILDRWRQPGDEATFPRLTLDETTYGLPSGFPWWNTDLFVFDADYLRMRNVTLGYNFENLKVKNLNFSQFRVAFNVTNLFTITNFPGLDPEVVRDFENAQDRNLSPNVTYLTPPQERSYNLSINFSF